jgi:hypothetical protein
LFSVRRLALFLGILAYFAVAFYVMGKTGIGCVFVEFLGIPCPGCGMTRALRALLRLDLAAAFSYNPLIFAMPYVFAYILFPMDGPVHRRILAVIGILAILIWSYRIICVV